MATQTVLGNSFRGATWVALHNGGCTLTLSHTGVQEDAQTHTRMLQGSTHFFSLFFFEKRTLSLLSLCPLRWHRMGRSHQLWLWNGTRWHRGCYASCRVHAVVGREQRGTSVFTSSPLSLSPSLPPFLPLSHLLCPVHLFSPRSGSHTPFLGARAPLLFFCVYIHGSAGPSLLGGTSAGG